MKSSLFFSVGIVATLFASLLYVRSRNLLVELSYEVTQKQILKKKLEQDLSVLRAELETLRAPSRIERLAKNDLGLTKPQQSVPMVIIKGDQGP